MSAHKPPGWRRLLSESVTALDALPVAVAKDDRHIELLERYPMCINPYYLSLIRQKDDPIYRQCIPDLREIWDHTGVDDPLNEEGCSPVPGLTHRYPDRVLFLVSARCAVYCRFCNRKRKVGRAEMVTDQSIREGIAYIRGHREVRDVLLSGGDPLLLGNQQLYHILHQIREISHVEIVRIGTRVPCTLPQRITPQLARMLREFHPLYIHTHFNHPREITPQAALACGRLADAGIPLGCQTVLLKGVNDSPGIIKELMQRLLMIRVRPYYLFQADLAKGTAHFWSPVRRGLEIISSLQGYTSGLCVPHFAIDLPGGGGKVTLLPDHVQWEADGSLSVKTYEGKTCHYPVTGE